MMNEEENKQNACIYVNHISFLHKFVSFFSSFSTNRPIIVENKVKTLEKKLKIIEQYSTDFTTKPQADKITTVFCISIHCLNYGSVLQTTVKENIKQIANILVIKLI